MHVSNSLLCIAKTLTLFYSFAAVLPLYHRRWAEQVYEDIYISVYKTDGYDSAVNLRNRVAERMARGQAFENYQQVCL